MLSALSSRFGEAQYFSCSTVADFYTWSKAEAGQMVRAFSVAGDTIVWNEGELTAAERGAGFNIAPEQTGPASSMTEAETLYDAERPFAIAREWSVSPEDLFERADLPPGVGRLLTLQSAQVSTASGSAD